MSALVLTLSPSSDITAMALFRGVDELRTHVASHPEADPRARRGDELGVRARAVRAFLEEAGIARGGLAAVAGRGGVLRPVEGGTYEICDALLRDAKRANADPANIGASLAHLIAAEWGCRGFIVDPESVDERETLARLAQGCDATPRGPALAMRAAARRHARAVDRPLEALRLVIVHLASDVALCAQRNGRMIEVADVWRRRTPCGSICGSVPDTALADLSSYRLGGSPTPVPIDGTPDLQQALARAERGDSRAILVLQAAAYRIANGIGELATVLEGEVDAVLLTGAAASAGPIIAELCRRVEWIAPVFPYRDESEHLALAEGALRVLTGEEPVKRYA